MLSCTSSANACRMLQHACPPPFSSGHFPLCLPGEQPSTFWERGRESNSGASVFPSSWVADLGEHGFAMLGHHAALVTVEGHKVAVECLLWVLKHIVQLRSTPLKDAAEVAWDQGPANSCRDGTNSSEPMNLPKTKTPLPDLRKTHEAYTFTAELAGSPESTHYISLVHPPGRM